MLTTINQTKMPIVRPVCQIEMGFVCNGRTARGDGFTAPLEVTGSQHRSRWIGVTAQLLPNDLERSSAGPSVGTGDRIPAQRFHRGFVQHSLDQFGNAEVRQPMI